VCEKQKNKKKANALVRDASRLLVLGTSCQVGSVFHILKGVLRDGSKCGRDVAVVHKSHKSVPYYVSKWYFVYCTVYVLHILYIGIFDTFVYV
jgi:NAD-dependent SIR2 family protein deacetylase